MLVVVEPGLLATIQDAGRPGFGHLGVVLGGACDGWSLAVAGLLLGDGPDEPGLEVTLGGTILEALETCVVGLAGADLGAEVGGRTLRPQAVHRLEAGQRLRFAGGDRGARAYVALPGGIDVPSVLGSASTDLRAGLGGIEGRALATGDRLAPRRPGDLDAAGRVWPAEVAPPPFVTATPIAVIPGPDVGSLPAGSLAAFTERTWTVEPASDRMGIRLAGPTLDAGREIVSQPVVPGSIQVTGSGLPIVLHVDAQTVGGYPVIAVAARSELPRLGQLRAGDPVRFEVVTADEARRRTRAQREAVGRAAELLHVEGAWDRLASEARG